MFSEQHTLKLMLFLMLLKALFGLDERSHGSAAQTVIEFNDRIVCDEENPFCNLFDSVHPVYEIKEKKGKNSNIEIVNEGVPVEITFPNAQKFHLSQNDHNKQEFISKIDFWNLPDLHRDSNDKALNSYESFACEDYGFFAGQFKICSYHLLSNLATS